MEGKSNFVGVAGAVPPQPALHVTLYTE